MLKKNSPLNRSINIIIDLEKNSMVSGIIYSKSFEKILLRESKSYAEVLIKKVTRIDTSIEAINVTIFTVKGKKVTFKLLFFPLDVIYSDA